MKWKDAYYKIECFYNVLSTTLSPTYGIVYVGDKSGGIGYTQL